jgi:hypothetical protein
LVLGGSVTGGVVVGAAVLDGVVTAGAAVVGASIAAGAAFSVLVADGEDVVGGVVVVGTVVSGAAVVDGSAATVFGVVSSVAAAWSAATVSIVLGRGTTPATAAVASNRLRPIAPPTSTWARFAFQITALLPSLAPTSGAGAVWRFIGSLPRWLKAVFLG